MSSSMSLADYVTFIHETALRLQDSLLRLSNKEEELSPYDKIELRVNYARAIAVREAVQNMVEHHDKQIRGE